LQQKWNDYLPPVKNSVGIKQLGKNILNDQVKIFRFHPRKYEIILEKDCPQTSPKLDHSAHNSI
jgi:hypothetical protein